MHMKVYISQTEVQIRNFIDAPTIVFKSKIDHHVHKIYCVPTSIYAGNIKDQQNIRGCKINVLGSTVFIGSVNLNILHIHKIYVT